MILAYAVVIGLVVAWIRFRRETVRRLTAISIRALWLLLIAVAFQIPFLRLPSGPVQGFLMQQGLFVVSFLPLLIFVWLNRSLLGVILVGVGLLANLTVILANGGAMPIAPETLVKINPGSSQEQWIPGNHYDHSKDDIIRESEDTYRLATLEDLEGGTICVQTGTTTELNLSDVMASLGVTYTPAVFEDADSTFAAYAEGRCDAVTTDKSGLVSRRSVLPDPAAHNIMDVTMSKEPLGPMVRHGDDQWFDIAQWTVFTLIAGEEFDFTTANVDDVKANATALRSNAFSGWRVIWV